MNQINSVGERMNECDRQAKRVCSVSEEKHYPELVFGLVGAIGCNIHAVEVALADALKEVNYTSHQISLSESIADLTALKTGSRPTLNTLEEKIDAGNKVRELFKQKGILAVDAIRKIRKARAKGHATQKNTMPRLDDTGQSIAPEEFPSAKTAYIIRQLKRKEEIELLALVYGKQFIQVSISQEKTSRLDNISLRAGVEQPSLDNDARNELARRLVKRDENEDQDEEGNKIEYGQKLGEIFQYGDVFVDASTPDMISKTCRRFIRALFGQTDIAPTKDEFGSYLAKAASLRSVDLSRQVGAAILSQHGDLITIGCNEVPKPLGGNYWDEDELKARDVDKRAEANKAETNRIIFDFLQVLKSQNVLTEGLSPKDILANSDTKNAINDSLIGGITEYGRMVHAEMNAITDAARLGRSVKDATLYVTTFPCHNCAKHIIASGIRRVIFIEPYPKSRTELLYSDAIANSTMDINAIHLGHFSGISPRRYRDIFEKGKRRNKSGEVHDWYEDLCKPRIGHREANYVASELQSIEDNFGSLVGDD
ncbi:anti-phage dCTP deaminase [Loktanella sp. S4079]|uniref:anti-phage dCTP deaminase n=1 Tax=Loktanella sp. S4079 TaxID=579483 RepID=UPI00138DDD71|nr:anti-phage dCTP deaminase [Loktanella sp. S4079]